MKYKAIILGTIFAIAFISIAYAGLMNKVQPVSIDNTKLDLIKQANVGDLEVSDLFNCNDDTCNYYLYDTNTRENMTRAVNSYYLETRQNDTPDCLEYKDFKAIATEKQKNDTFRAMVQSTDYLNYEVYEYKMMVACQDYDVKIPLTDDELRSSVDDDVQVYLDYKANQQAIINDNLANPSRTVENEKIVQLTDGSGMLINGGGVR